jgi:glutamate racemase
MVKIVVFDSGLGSLSIIKAIQKRCKSKIIYFADQKNFPYGEKSKSQLKIIINQTIELLEKHFSPDLIVMASNTPSLMVKIQNKKVIKVYPPVKEAFRLSKTKKIAILATKTVIKSKDLSDYVRNLNLTRDKKIFKVNSSSLVELVENNSFITNEKQSRKIIKKILGDVFKNKIDVATLSSTHLSFLKPLLITEFPNVNFIDPVDNVTDEILKNIRNNESNKNTIEIFTSGNITLFQKNLQMLDIKNKVKFLST